MPLDVRVEGPWVHRVQQLLQLLEGGPEALPHAKEREGRQCESGHEIAWNKSNGVQHQHFSCPGNLACRRS